ncbi:centrosomal protein of 131 kDa isoform X1 [Polyodon spathula]|uniref:centrosomal protein of 131 kDa isoform X1 n=1 Tax=Polyodon spathula TaxID=7913 RepID=UPI001B7F0AE6|nr:centrosomal protein of 131 kDa isoform X1 [Polyodon spathula]XP_041075703.1 centrosomal protein of 131 kDa isoform X1 [Polyodon spathula]XP_041075704.1 centrosomal protein of 131 kDa isoform X1 [Polyodon spathula]XP_041075705.1 centrosomal protein of 131 kDa isoform X1 [Polyodon spathula]
MHMDRSPSSLPGSASVGAGDSLELSLTGSQLSVSRRPSSASPAKHFSRSVSVTADNKSKRNTLGEAGLGSCRSIKNLRRSNSTTQVNQRVNSCFSEEQSEDFLALFDSSSDGRRKLASLRKTSPDLSWNILDDQPRTFQIPGSGRSARTADSPAGMKKREAGIALAANFTANNRSNKGAVGNSVTTILHNNCPDKPLTPKSSNQKPASLNNIMKATVNDEGSLENSSLTKSQKNFSSPNNNAAHSSPALLRRQEVTEEEAESRFIQQVNHAAVTIQRWYRRHAHRRHTSEAALRRLLSTKKQEREQRAEEGETREGQKRKEEDRKRIREEKAQQARRAAIQELQQKRAQRAAETQRVAEQEIEALKQSGKLGRRKPARPSPGSKGSTAGRDTGKGRIADSGVNVTADLDDVSNLRSGSPTDSPGRGSQGSQKGVSVEEQLQRAPSSRAQSKTTLNELLDTLKLLEEDPERLPEPHCYRKEKYSWIDEDRDSNSLTADNLELLGKMSQPPALPDGGALLSEAKLQSIMSFLDEMEKSEQERPRSVTSGSHREALLSEEDLAQVDQASAKAAEVTGCMMRMKLELEEKRRTINMLQTALAQQRELTVRHIKETEKELNRNFQLQKDQYEATIQRHLAFIDQLIDDKKALSDRCEGVVTELKQVDQKYTKKIAHMQEQHDLVWHILGPLCEEIKKLKELMSATEKIRREKWIDEKTKKIKEITVKGLEPEIQKLISKHKQELQKLRAVHEAELMQADERAAQRYVRQSEEMREQLEREKEEQCQRERELARQRYEKQLQEEEQALQQQRRRLYSEVAEEKERGAQLAARQRAELDELRKQLEDNSLVAGRALREEFERTREEQERRHQAEVKALKERLDIEKQAWEENYMKKEEAWLLSRERELKEEVRRGRDKEIELVIQRLEEETSRARDECERASENRVKRVREKYETELRELERSERSLQERHSELKGRLSQAEGEAVRLQGLLRQKEQEVQDITQIQDRLTEERRSLAEVIRQEFADRLVTTEEENRRMKIEMSETRARQRLELERVTREKEEELAEVHKRVKTAIVKKEETVNNLRKQHEAALKRADHLEALLEQQRKQLLGK